MEPTAQQQPVPAALVPPFTEETARAKVKAAENLWNTKDPEKVWTTLPWKKMNNNKGIKRLTEIGISFIYRYSLN